LAITLDPEMLESRSRTPKAHFGAQNPKKFWAKKSAHWINRWHHPKNNLSPSWSHQL